MVAPRRPWATLAVKTLMKRHYTFAAMGPEETNTLLGQTIFETGHGRWETGIANDACTRRNNEMEKHEARLLGQDLFETPDPSRENPNDSNKGLYGDEAKKADSLLTSAVWNLGDVVQGRLLHVIVIQLRRPWRRSLWNSKHHTQPLAPAASLQRRWPLQLELFIMACEGEVAGGPWSSEGHKSENYSETGVPEIIRSQSCPCRIQQQLLYVFQWEQDLGLC
ncbi:uncharacterized protein LOC120394382 [Mauremys reevesii]|uniref:uncharacterized protein LOC120394382 n=1 Tax=Mauremys reevesii TaxID=260615 RepID=UPI00193FA9A3|nr:uncharacterized protein LOC120394382 [Mauremys reevesii]